MVQEKQSIEIEKFMNFGIKNIESKIESLLKQNNFDTKVHFQYSSYNNFDIQCNAFSK